MIYLRTIALAMELKIFCDLEQGGGRNWIKRENGAEAQLQMRGEFQASPSNDALRKKGKEDNRIIGKRGKKTGGN